MRLAFAVLASVLILSSCWDAPRPVETKLLFRPATNLSEFSCVFANIRTPGFVPKAFGALTQAKVGCLGLEEFSPLVTASVAVGKGVVIEARPGPNKRIEVLGVKGVDCSGKTVPEILQASGAQLFELGSATVDVAAARTVVVKGTYTSDSVDRIEACLSPLRILTTNQKFGTALLGGITYRPFWILNQSESAVTISSISSTAPQFAAFTGRSCYPTIPIGKVCELSLGFTPTSTASVSGTVSVNYSYAGDARSAEVGVAAAADVLTGTADNAYGSANGRLIQSYGSALSSDFVFDAALDSGGNLLLAGQADVLKYFLRRLKPDGSNDTSFGDPTGPSSFVNQLTGLAIDPATENLFVTGRLTDSVTEGLFAKYLSDGAYSLVDGFSGGYRRIDFGSALTPMEPIVGPSSFFAYVRGLSTSDPVKLGRFSRKDGTLISMTTVTLPGSMSFDAMQTVQSIRGKIYTVGRGVFPPATDGDIVVVRFNEDGSLDTGWGTSGFKRIDLDGALSDDRPRAIAVMTVSGSDFLFVAGGVVRVSENSFVAKLNSSGALDTNFGSGGSGRYEYDLASGYQDYVVSVVAQPDEAPLLLSQKLNGSGDRAHVVWRLKDDGTGLDTSGFNSSAGFGGVAGAFAHPVCVDDAPTRLVVGGASAYIVGVAKKVTGIAGCDATVTNAYAVKIK